MNPLTAWPAKAEYLAEERRRAILAAPDALVITGTRYYVAQNGSDDNDGRSPDAPWRTLEKVSQAALCPGDGVLFRRGDIFRGKVTARPGVSYGAYGTGEKPRFFGWKEDLADPALWVCADAAHSIWRYTAPIPDVDVLVYRRALCLP